MPTPKQLGYYFPAEWEKHEATWLSWPHNSNTWPGKIESIFNVYCEFISLLAKGEKVRINVCSQTMQQEAEQQLQSAAVDLRQIEFFIHPTNDAWCRDHGPAFIVNKDKQKRKAVIDWDYNAWGGKYPPYDFDDIIPTKIAEAFGLECFHPGIIMEGGSVDFNGAGTLLTTRSCLLNPNRNRHLGQREIEQFLIDYYGVDQVLWLDEGIEGDDTDGHIDDLTRFVSADTVVTVVAENKSHPDYQVLHRNQKALSGMRLLNGAPLTVIELPMPAPFLIEGQVLPCSYANFYISNAAVIVPLFEDPHDESALELLTSCFKDREVVGLDSRDIIWGLGSFHCLSQQEPLCIGK